MFAMIGGVMTGSDLRQARLERGWTQEQLGVLIGETKTVVGNWERGDHVPRRKEEKVRRALYATTSSTESDYLRALSDTALIAELARRLAERDVSNGTVHSPSPITPEGSPAVNVKPNTTTPEGIAGPHSPPRRHPRGSSNDAHR